MYITHTFSTFMIQSFPANLIIEEISTHDAKSILATKKVKSAIGFSNTALLFSNILEVKLKRNKKDNILLTSGDSILIGQYIGNRLKEGTKQLPDKSIIKWILVSVK